MFFTPSWFASDKNFLENPKFIFHSFRVYVIRQGHPCFSSVSLSELSSLLFSRIGFHVPAQCLRLIGIALFVFTGFWPFRVCVLVVPYCSSRSCTAGLHTDYQLPVHATSSPRTQGKLPLRRIQSASLCYTSTPVNPVI